MSNRFDGSIKEVQRMRGGSVREPFHPARSFAKQLTLPETFSVDSDRPGIPMSVFGNDIRNDCVIAARANHTLRLAYMLDTVITDEEVIEEYEREVKASSGGVYRDDGLQLSVSLESWKRDGWIAAGSGPRRIANYYPIDFGDRNVLRNAIVTMVGVQIAIDLPEAYSEVGRFGVGQRWSDTDAAREFNHAVLLVGYDSQDVQAITWGTYQSISWEFAQKFCTSAYAVAAL